MKIRYILSIALLTVSARLGAQSYKTVESFSCPEATQGVAVDDDYFYGIGNQTIAKYTLKGERVALWHEGNLWGIERDQRIVLKTKQQ